MSAHVLLNLLNELGKTDAVSRTVLHMSIPDLGRVYQHLFKLYCQAGNSVPM